MIVAVLVVSISIGAVTRVFAAPAKGGGRSAQGYLGVDVRDLSDEEMNALRVKDVHGAEIIRLDHDGPACKAGMREHDVILQMDARPVDGQDQFRRMLHETPAGRSVTFVLLRDGQQMTISATMANREEVERIAWERHLTVVDPDGPPPPSPAEGPGGHVGSGSSLGFLHGGLTAQPGARRGFLGTMLGAPYTGLVVEPVGPQLGEFFGVQSGVGLLVKSVDENSPAAEAGMRAGDVVIKANQITMATESDWSKSLHENKGKTIPVLVLRDKKEQTLSLTPDAKRKSRVQRPGVDEPDEARLDGMSLL